MIMDKIETDEKKQRKLINEYRKRSCFYILPFKQKKQNMPKIHLKKLYSIWFLRLSSISTILNKNNLTKIYFKFEFKYFICIIIA